MGILLDYVSGALVVALFFISYAVAYFIFKRRSAPWELVLFYWLVLSAKNFIDLFRM